MDLLLCYFDFINNHGKQVNLHGTERFRGKDPFCI